MRWVRTNRQFGAWCALFALAVQLTLSFGHVHLSGFGKASGQATLLSTADAAVASSPKGSKAPKPAVPADDYCAICAVMSLAGSVVPPVVPAIPPPAIRSTLVSWPIVEAALTSEPHFDAHARGPPQA